MEDFAVGRRRCDTRLIVATLREDADQIVHQMIAEARASAEGVEVVAEVSEGQPASSPGGSIRAVPSCLS
jgi:hypothetical protein